MGATAVIVNEGKEAFAEAKVSDELRNLKKSLVLVTMLKKALKW